MHNLQIVRLPMAFTRLLSVALLAFLWPLPELALAIEVNQPLVAWNAQMPMGIDWGDIVDPNDVMVQQGSGWSKELNAIRIVPPVDSARAAECKIYWLKNDDQHPVVSLASAMLKSINPTAQIAASIQCGDVLATPLDLHEFTACIKFKLTAPLCYGGAPPTELDGKLISLSPSVDIGILGSGPTGKAERCVYIEFGDVSGTRHRYVGAPGSAVNINRWTSLLISWQGNMTAAAKDSPSLWINGKAVALQSQDGDVKINSISINGPIRIGGDGSYAAVPIELEGFAIYDKSLPWEKAFAALSTPMSEPVHSLPPDAFSCFTHFDNLIAPASWDVSGEGLQLSNLPQNVLVLELAPAALKKKGRLMLKQGIDVRKNQIFQFWTCSPAFSGPEAAQTINAIFTDSSGTEYLVPATSFDNNHVAPPNGRAAGLWQVVTIEAPERKGKCQFRGFQVEYQSESPYQLSRFIYLRDFGLDGTDYTKAALYYVIGNYRDNFAMVAFNGSGARALTDVTGGSRYPYLLLDNAVDQAKENRPQKVNLHIECFDANDNLVWNGSEKGLNARDALDMFHKIEIPITHPGTYWIKSKSYDSATGEYFTTDWTQLVIIRGGAALSPPIDLQRRNLLYVNPTKPFGRLEKNDSLKIDFVISNLPQTEKEKTSISLKYDVIPYSPWVPGRKATRSTTLTNTLTIEKAGIVTVPYRPKGSVELVIAELWINGKRMDREERMIGVRNDIDATVQQDASIPGIKELAAQTGGLLINSHFNSLLDDCGDRALEVFTNNLDQARKISPLVEFIPSMERLEPMPGVYDWDYLQEFFDAAKAHQCALVLYFMQKWPTSWAPVDFMMNEGGRAHHIPVVWGHMVGAYNYSTGATAPEIIKTFNQQLARRFVNEPGFAAYYFENEHIPNSGPNSYDAGNGKKFQQWLKDKYQAIAELNKAYGSSHQSFDEIEMPTSNIAKFPRKIMHVDWEEYRFYAVENFTLKSQFETVRAEDKRRPIMVYTVGEHMSARFLKHIADDGGLITNGGVHSVLDSDVYREQFCQVPGLLERMEPHDVFHYEPYPHGLDEMIFGMLGLGGRGMNFHFILQVGPDQPFSYDAYHTDGRIGYGKFLGHLNEIKNIRGMEKAHDPVGIMVLRGAWDYALGVYYFPVRNMMSGLYVNNHYEPKIYSSGGDLSYLDDTKIIFVTGELIDKTESNYLASYLEKGGKIVLDDSAASFSCEKPDDEGDVNNLLKTLRADALSEGQKIPGVNLPHDVYRYGQGEIALIRSKDLLNKWEQLTTAFVSWAGIKNPMVSSDDSYMQMHTLRGADGDYLAVTHRGVDVNAYNGPKEWSGKIRYLCPSTPDEQFDVSQVWAEKEESLGRMSAKDLADGFNAGHFDELEMKVFHIEPVK